MQKNWCLIFVFVLVFSFVFVSSLDSSYIDNQAKSIDQQVKGINSNIETTKTTLINDEVRSAYLKKQWVSILESREGFKQIISAYRIISPYTNPALKYAVGIVPELSFFFVLVFVIWFFLVKYYFTTYEVLRDFSTFSKGASFAISFIIFVILIAVKFFQNISLFLANKLVALTEFLTSPIMKIIFGIAFVVAIVFLSKFSKQVTIIAGKIREGKEKMKRAQEEADLLSRQRGAVRTVERYAEAVNEED